jgi:hypothetical protein
MIFLIPFLIIIVGIVLEVITRKYVSPFKQDILLIICCGLQVLGGVALIIFSSFLVISIASKNSTIEQNRNKYESLIYQYENEDCCSYGKKLLYEEIDEWNSYIEGGKRCSKNIWLSPFFDEECYDFPTIEHE